MRCAHGLIVATLLVVHATTHAASPPPSFAAHAMAVSASDYASEAGAEIMRAGGNAVDAAVAVGFTLAVTYPQAGNIGGGGFMVVRLADGEAFTLDFRERAPAAAHRNMFLDTDGNVVEDMSLFTHAASGVPGSVDGLLRAFDDHGSGHVSRRDVLRPAIRLAKHGFPLSQWLAHDLNTYAHRFTQSPAASEIFTREDGQPWRAGDLLRQPDLAKTLERIAREGRDGFYTGRTARLLAQEMNRGNGTITESDLADYTSTYRDAIRGTFLGREIISMPPPSSGGLLLVHMLSMLEILDVQDYPWGSADYIHLLTEVERRAYADRAVHLGDSDFWDVPSDGLTSVPYAEERAATIDMQTATPSDTIAEGKPTAYESPDTTHYSVVDAQGNCVVVTTTLNLSFGSGIVVEGAGFFLNNEMDDFAAKPGEPNAYGLLGAEANAIEPGKRMLSSMTPTIVAHEGTPVLLVGSPGGSTIITTVLQIILNTTVHNMNIAQAVSAPRIHHQWQPDSILPEFFAISPDTARILESRGHTLREATSAIGQAHCIMIAEDGIYGAADPRGGDSAAAGY